MNSSGDKLGNELSAWDALSDEALETVDAMTKRYFTNSTSPDAFRTEPEWDPVEQRIQQLEDAVKSLSRRQAELECQVRTGLADAGQRLERLEYVVNELDDERSSRQPKSETNINQQDRAKLIERLSKLEQEIVEMEAIDRQDDESSETTVS